MSHQPRSTIRSLTTPTPPIPATSVNKILIRSVNWLGDIIMEIPLLRKIRKTFPEAELHVVIRNAFSPLMKLVPEVDKVISFPKRGGIQETQWDLKLSRKLRKQQFDLAFIVPRSFRSAFAPGLAQIPVRIGYRTGPRLITHALPSPDFYWEDHRVHYYLRLLSHWYEGRIEVSPPKLKIPAQLKETVREQFLSKSKSQETVAKTTTSTSHPPHTESVPSPDQPMNTRPVIAMNPGASYGSAKRWTPERFAALACQLVQSRNARILLLGSGNESHYVNKIEQIARQKCAERSSCHKCLIRSTAGETTVNELAALLSECNLLITNDTGPKHVADAVGTPTVAIYGSTDPSGLHPYSGKTTVIQEPVHCSPCWKRHCPIDHRCMTRISVPQVRIAAENWLSQ